MNYIKGLNRWLLIFMFILPTILLLVFDFYFFEIPEIFEGANKVGKIIYGLFFSTIAAYIFYIATVYIPEFKLKSSVNVGLKAMLNDMVTHVDKLASRISLQSGVEINRQSSLETLNNALLQIDIRSTPQALDTLSPIVFANWQELMIHHISSMGNVINMITMRYITVMDPKLISLFHTIETCGFSKDVLTFRSVQLGGDLHGFASGIKSYFEIINTLEVLKNELT